MKSYDAVVIGGGPAGTTAALYLLRSGVSVAMVEKLAPGGQILLTEEIENYPGFPKGIKGYELVDLFSAQLDAYPHDKIRDEVSEIKLGKGVHRIKVGDEWIECKSIVLCSGARFSKLGVPGEGKYLGRGVSYCALCDGNFFRGKVVAVVGGGNSALEEALYLARITEKVYLIHRRDEFRGDKHYQEKCLANPKIEPLLSKVVEEIVGDDDVKSIALKDTKTGEKSSIDLDGVFIFVGYLPNFEFIPGEVDRDRVGIITDVEMRTNIPGVFAAGDVRSKACRQVATAVGDGATAAHSAFIYLESLNA